MEQKHAILRVIFLSCTLLLLFSSMIYLALTDSETVQTRPRAKTDAPAYDLLWEDVSDQSSHIESDVSTEPDPAQESDTIIPPVSSAPTVTSEILETSTLPPTQAQESTIAITPPKFVSAEVNEHETASPSIEETPSKEPTPTTKPPSKPSYKPSPTPPSQPSSEPSSNPSSDPASTPSSVPPSEELPSPPPKPPESQEEPKPPDETTPEESAPSVPSEPSLEEIAAQNQKNDQFAKTLQQKYQIMVLILRSEEDDSEGLATQYATDPFQVWECLEICARALSLFPDRFFQDEVALALADQFLLTSPSQTIGSYLFLLVPYRDFSWNVLRSELLSYTEKAFLAEAEFSMDDYLPEDFLYGDPQSRYVFSKDNPGYGWFLSLSAQQSPHADIGEILRQLIQSPSLLEQAVPGTPFFEKCVYCAERFLSWRSVLSSNHAIQYFLYEGIE